MIPLPGWLAELGRNAVAEAYLEPEAGYRPDVALVNFYDADARLGMHQDRDERTLDPVVSLSLGAACLFRIGHAEHRGKPWTDIPLLSGDLLVFGRENRLAYHGVPALLPEFEVPDIDLDHGRLNIALRVSGLE
ncbi:MAG: hypothetical protein GEV09_05010 [Pseudonocardiaceae bacterium]|nr:hypothetical protein [Pseudonocardiaceae bacterium]